jgi:hypothetical protein
VSLDKSVGWFRIEPIMLVFIGNALHTITSKNMMHFSTVLILVVLLHKLQAILIRPAIECEVFIGNALPFAGSSKNEKLYFVIKERKSKSSSTFPESKAESHCNSKYPISCYYLEYSNAYTLPQMALYLVHVSSIVVKL